ncbi:MAG TPA: S9 family peptidase [Sphingopyxis sp.]|nr:S9 family peptidase [Sphingopyxis sp.]HMQ17695.1 S9 family peptidase [Sphingopyxis sp.]
MAVLPATTPAHAQGAGVATHFGAMESIIDVSLSPDGKRLAYVFQDVNRTRRLFTIDTSEGAVPRRILASDGGSGGNISWCGWVTNERLACQIYVRGNVVGNIRSATSIIALNADGGGHRLLSNRRNDRSLYADYRGGSVLDWSSDGTGSLLMTRSYVPESNIATHVASSAQGLGVDLVDVVSGRARRVEAPNRDAIYFLSDGNGNVRVMATLAARGNTSQYESVVRYFYRAGGGGRWEPLSQIDLVSEEGFEPVAVDPATNRAYGFQKIDGRKAVVAMTLDSARTVSTIYAHPEVDVDDVMRVGRDGRIVGVSYATEKRHAVITDPKLAEMAAALSKALGGKQIMIADAAADESRYVIRADSDTDAGTYFLFTPAAKELRPLLEVRPSLANLKLSPVKPVTYPAADGTMVPGYLTLPPGRSDAKGLPAIVLPHGGPSARDEWGFDWLSQYFAQSGFAVLQPNYRGSSGYGDQWFLNNGYQSWPTAIGDIADGGRWLVSGQGADPARLSIVGWSYGGYAALQSGVVAPDLFKAIVAIAPVTDLQQLRDESAKVGLGHIRTRMLGTGPHLRQGSPAQNADTITAPVLMFHGTFDQNVDVEQARTMRRALQGKSKRVELIEYPELAHSLESGEARIDMLRRISAFLPK